LGTTGLILLILLGLTVWFWQNTLTVRELAIATAREICARQNFQFLDSTVALHRLRVVRAPSGRLSLKRTFLFAYSNDGIERHTGFIIMAGNHVEQAGL